MNKNDHLESAKSAAAVLENNNLTRESRAEIVHHWAAHICAYMKGSDDVVATN